MYCLPKCPTGPTISQRIKSNSTKADPVLSNVPTRYLVVFWYTVQKVFIYPQSLFHCILSHSTMLKIVVIWQNMLHAVVTPQTILQVIESHQTVISVVKFCQV